MMFKVRIFLMTSYKGLKKSSGWYIGITEYITEKGPATIKTLDRLEDVTANQLALTGLIKAMERLNKPCEIEIFTDSKYLESAWSLNWLKKWQETGWQTAKGEEVKNADLWKMIVEKIAPHSVEIRVAQKTEYSEWQRRELLRAMESEEKNV